MVESQNFIYKIYLNIPLVSDVPFERSRQYLMQVENLSSNILFDLIKTHFSSVYFCESKLLVELINCRWSFKHKLFPGFRNIKLTFITIDGCSLGELNKFYS